MVISSKLVDLNGLEFAVSEDTDTIDAGGFSDPIQVVGAETAKFSGGATMQANTGLRIGLTQVKVNAGAEILRDRNIESNIGWSAPNDAIDGNTNTAATSQTTGNVLVIDFESIDTRELSTELGNSRSTTSTANISVEISDDNISYTTIGTFAQVESSKTLRNHGSQTWRYVRITFVSEINNPIAGIHRVFETNAVASTTTIRIRSSATIDTADGTVIVPDTVINPSTVTTFDTDLLLTGNAQFVTLEIVSVPGFPIPINLQEITSIKEV